MVDVLGRFDKWLCGETQVPVEQLLTFGMDEKVAQELLRARFLSALGVITEVCGGGLITSALANTKSVINMGIGLGLTTGGRMLRWHNGNAAGSIVRVMGQEVLNRLGDSLGTLSQAMADSGISSTEIRSMESLPNELYVTEIGSYNLDLLGQSASSLVQATILGLAGRWDLGVIVGLSTPTSAIIGDRFYKQSDLGRRAWTRLAISAGDGEHLKDLTDAHVRMTDKLNAFPLLKEMMIGAAYLSQMPGQVLMTMRAVAEGMGGLSGMLTKQRTRVSAKEAVERFNVVAEVVQNGPMILTDKRLGQHVEKSEEVEQISVKEMERGVVINNFIVRLPNGDMSELTPLSFCKNGGEAIVVKGKSGMGKTKMALGLQHLLEHDGEVYFVKNEVGRSVHEEKSLVDIKKKILFKDPAGIREGLMLGDLFKEPCFQANREIYQEHVGRVGKKYARAFWLGDMAVLMKECGVARKGESYAFNVEILRVAEEVLEIRRLYTDSQLQGLGGNLESERINSQAVWDRSRLSQGEMNRLAVAISLAYVKEFKPNLVILDEPLDKLDPENFEYQIKTLRKIVNVEDSPVLMIITHNHAAKLAEEFGAEIKCLDKDACTTRF